MTLDIELEQLVAQAKAAFLAADTPVDLENAKSQFLGKNGAITHLLKGLANLDIDNKKIQGASINVAKQTVESALNAARQSQANSALNKRLNTESIDVTLPGRGLGVGNIHPIMRMWIRIEEIFRSIGFDVADGPELEDDWHNFSALNNPENHPARSMQDTFYINGHTQTADGKISPLLLRTHTSPMQVRYARAKSALGISDIRVIAPGRTYRVDSDATHSPMFHQVEGLWIGEQVSFADLKGVYTHFLKALFETDTLSVRFRPSYFPFTEPSAEVDLMFDSGPLKGQWLEVSGSGQVHPNVIRHFGLDPEKVMGFAFGSGIERLAMLRYGINDLRLFYENDMRFLKQFA